MNAVTTLPVGREFTRADLDALPDDGNRHELIDGALIVTPAPVPRHQMIVSELLFQLRSRVPAELRVLTGPLDVALSPRRILQPDVLVARRDAFSTKDLPSAPLLAVEVLSPSTRLIDLNLKKAAYEEAGCPAYWVVDPVEPAITAWQLIDGTYRQIARRVGDERFDATLPFPVSFTPAQLLI